jgi:hypothetical protein
MPIIPMRGREMWNRALLVVILSASPAAAQIPVARFKITARIMKAGSLSLGPSDTGIALLQASMAGSSSQIHVRVRPHWRDGR